MVSRIHRRRIGRIIAQNQLERRYERLLYARLFKRMARLNRTILVQFKRNGVQDLDIIFEQFSSSLVKDLFSVLKAAATVTGKQNIADIEKIINTKSARQLEINASISVYEPLVFIEETKQIFELFETSIVDWLRSYSLLKATTIARHQQARARKILEKIVEEGLGEEQGAIRLQQLLGDNYARFAATRVVRTEVHTAVNRATQLSTVATTNETGIKFNKVWISTEDSRTRPTHDAADGQTVPTEKPFIVGGVELMYPGDPDGPANEIINCRCQALYEPDL